MFARELHTSVLHTLIMVVLGAIAWNAHSGLALAADSPRPNIVLILCDDLGYGDLACYGHPHIKTPHLDRLASDGIRFTACYSAAPVCSASRVGLLTGRIPNRAGVYDWIPAANRVQPDGRDQVHMRREEITIPRLLQLAGYATCQAGKWHCNGHFNSPEQPQPGDFGFDHWLATQDDASPSHENPSNFVRNGKPVGPTEGYSCQLVVDEAVAWLDARADADQPFFLYLPFHEPHEPVMSPPELVAKYMSVARNEDEAQYFANVENVDRAVGRLVSALERMGKSENTLIIFTADNGPETLRRYRGAGRSYGRPGPLRGMKLWTTEAGFRVAGIMRWPGHIEPGQVSDEPIWSLDFFPTFCDLAGTVLPEGLELDGANFLPVLRGQPIERERPLFWCYFNALNEHRVAMREGEWKLLAKLGGGQFPKFENIHTGNIEAVRTAKLTDFELYRISGDVGESENVADSYREQAARLQVKMESIYRDLADTSHHWTVPSAPRQ